ncbi:MAG: hypothetical protein QOI74_1416 [Micromonosporaceae bacterium]|nr:hypothetical protein [Micromonosporaceae bacterium]
MGVPVRRVDRIETPVMFVSAPDESDEIGPAWDRLESAIGSLRGRRFFGVFDDSGIYRCCVQARPDDDSVRLGLDSGVIPGGRYLCATVRAPQPAAYALITPTFHELRDNSERDSTRPSIEYYRRHDRIDLLMPVPDGT